MTSKIKITGVLLSSLFIFSNSVSAADMSFGKLKSDICSSCHGLKGISPFPFRPNLAGQDADYIVHQLKAFKSGFRINDTMKQISESLSDGEMITLANYYSRQPTESIDGGDPLLIKKGKEKYSLCWSCHGDNGEGAGSYPRIASQHSQYTVQELKNFRNGSRKNPVMKAIISELSLDDMEALGAYLATLNPHIQYD
ncbi:MAG: cytochrome c [Methylococcales bacterium]|nr:cytochrome c [Methylococcales bacterium]